MARIVRRQTIEGQWKCPTCGTINKGRNSICTSCATPRGTTRVDLPHNPETAPRMSHEDFRKLVEEADTGTSGDSRDYTPKPNVRDSADTSDWLCEYCGRTNGSWRSNCYGCGAPRNHNTPTYHEITAYSDRHKVSREEAARELSEQLPEKESDDSYSRPTHEEDRVNTSSYTSEDNNEVEENVAKESNLVSIFNDTKESVKTFFGNLLELIQDNIKCILTVMAIIAVIAGIIWIVTPHPKDIVSTGFDWQREIRISELRTVKENDWDVPRGGRVYDERWEHHHDEKVHDGWHDEYYTEYERQCVGTRQWTEYVDNGDGSYDAVTYEEYVYEDVPVTKTRRVEDYHYEPVFQTKYYYEIERWRYNRSVITSGNDKNPYWGEVILSGPTGEYGTGEEREESREEYYGVSCEDGDHYKVNSYELWKKLELGANQKVMIQLGTIVELSETR